MLFEATHKSAYSVDERLNKIANDETVDKEALKERDRIESNAIVDIDIKEKYADQYSQLNQMMQEIINEDCIDFDLSTIK